MSYLWCQVWFAYGPAQWWCDKPRLKHVWTWSNSQTLSGCLFVLFKCLGCGGQAFFYLELNWVFCVSFLCPVPSSLTCSPRCRLGLSDFTSLPCFFPPKNTLFWGAAVIIIVKSQTLLAKIALRWWNFGANFLWTPKLQGHHRLLGPGWSARTFSRYWLQQSQSDAGWHSDAGWVHNYIVPRLCRFFSPKLSSGNLT